MTIMMAMRAAALTAATLAIPALALASDGTFDKTLNVSGTVQLEVSTGSGYVHVNPGSDSQVHIIGHVHANHGWMGGNSEDQVRHVVDNPPIQQSGNTIRVGEMHESLFNHVSIDYDITAPKSTHLKAESGSGDLKAASMNGGVRLETGSGSINGDDLGGEGYLQTGSGDIRVNFSSGTNVTAGTGSGSIRLTGVKGSLKAETGSGDISIAGQPTDAWKIEAGSGSIDLNLGGSKFTLDAETGSGSIHTDQAITMQGSLERHHITGNVNGGGPTVKVETGSGSIRIH
jgi:Putative adhesin